jgi:putative lipoic acid-binding regulatory protein
MAPNEGLVATMSEQDESPLKFPCQFPIKAMGRAQQDLDSVVATIVRRHAQDLSEAAIRTTHSARGNYVSITVTVNATSREQLDAIYLDLSACEDIIMVL